MSSTSIPDDIRRYVFQCIPSVPYLEAVLLLRERRDLAWQPEVLARRLYLGTEDTLRLLARMQSDGLVVLDAGEAPGYRYAPSSSDLGELWDRLVHVYAHHLIEVSTIIHSKPSGKAQLLADAFVWRKEK
ncbi:MAG: hypothetical protein K0R43_1558 [Pseudoduganella sp.]|jgi:hypothetical protein|nr:hypothetical protein [Pseudoduganella sp.]